MKTLLLIALLSVTAFGESIDLPGLGVSKMGAVGSTPNANGASVSGRTLTLQPADATHPGVVTTGTQTMAGAKTFSTSVKSPAFISSTASPATSGAFRFASGDTACWLNNVGNANVCLAKDTADTLNYNGGSFYVTGTLAANGNSLQLNRGSAAAQTVSVINGEGSGSSVFSGGTSATSGGNLAAYGASHATKANQLEFRSGSTVYWNIDGNGNLNYGGNVAASTNPLSIRLDNNGLTRVQFRNGSTGASANMKLTVTAADDFDFIATGTNNTPQASINAGSGFTSGLVIAAQAGGMSLQAAGSNPVTVKTNGSNRLSVDSSGVVNFLVSGNETTGAGSAALGANCPAVTATAPFKWLTVKLSDGSTGYVPVWK